MFKIIQIGIKFFKKNKIFFLFLVFSENICALSLGEAAVRFASGGMINVGCAYLLEGVSKNATENQQEAPVVKAVENGENNSDLNKITFKDVVGLDSVVVEVKEVVDFLKNPEEFRKLGAKMPKGILLEGPPGTGKTLIAKAIASEADCKFFYASGAAFVELFVGMGAKRVRELFQNASKSKPSIIFIDEIDAIGASNRGASANEEYRQTLNELLCQMDGFKENDSIIVIAATNNANVLDKALKRPGRFTRIIHVSNPNKDARIQILKYYVGKLPKTEISDQYVEIIANKTEGYSGAELENLINEAVLYAVRNKAEIVNEEHLEFALKKLYQKK